MTQRIVVSCRWEPAPAAGEQEGPDAPGYLERARALTRRAEALGATLAAWSAVTLAFAWDDESIEEAIAFVSELHAEGSVAPDPGVTPEGRARWASGIAEGQMEPLAEAGRGDLAWGPPLVAAVALARIAAPGEVLVDRSVAALEAGKLLTTGSRVEVVDRTYRVRGARLDVRQPWRAEAAKSVSRITRPALLGRPDPRVLLEKTGAVNLLRADPGYGGSRMLHEVAARVAPAPCLLVMPSGASVEPLGALRRALVRALASFPAPKDDVLGPQLDMFLGGIGASIEVAAMLVESWFKTAPPGSSGALLIDDAGEVDAESLEACAQLVAWGRVPLYVTVRVDATDALPSALFDLSRGIEMDLEPLGQPDAEALARACTGGALTPRAAARWARRGSYSPLGILEAIQCGLTTGELAWIGDRASERSRASGMGKAHGAAHWITKRAKKTTPNERGMLAAVALFGGEVSLDNAERALHAVDAPIQVREEAARLVKARWLVPTEPGWVALPTRTHRDTIAELLDEEPRRALHRAIAEVLEQSEGELGCAEAAHHAAKAGDGERGARLALRAARAAAAASMTKSANRLLTLARLADPKCEPQTRRALISSLPPPQGAPPRAHPSPAAPPLPPPPPTSKTLDVTPTERVSIVSAEAAAHVLAASPVVQPDRASEPPTLIDPPSPARVPPPAPSAPARVSPAPPPVIPRPPHAAESDASMARPPRPPLAPPPPVLRPPMQTHPSRGAMPAVPAPPASSANAAASGAPPSVRPPPPRAAPPVARAREEPSERTLLGSAPPSSGAMRAASKAPSGAGATAPPAGTRGRTAWSLPEDASDDERTIAGAGRPATPAAMAPLADVTAPHAREDEETVAGRLADLARAALLGGDAGALERWSEGLRATGEHERFAERMEGMAHLSRGQIGDALRILKKARETAEEGSRAQASLALGVALAAAGRPEEALLEGLDALARARETLDDKGASACLAFLAKLFTTQKKTTDADQLRSAARAPAPSRART